MMALSQTSTKEIGKLLQTSRLRDRLDKASQVILPGNKTYDTSRQAWNLAIDQYPALIIIANTAGDIAEAIRFAQAQGLKVAVQATGHGLIREADNSLLLITSQMTDVYVNASTQTAWISAGTKWEVVLAQTQTVGLAPLLGPARWRRRLWRCHRNGNPALPCHHSLRWQPILPNIQRQGSLCALSRLDCHGPG
jgi:hypothetical protein